MYLGLRLIWLEIFAESYSAQRCYPRYKPKTLAIGQNGTAKKGDVLGVARIAAIMAAKKTRDLIPSAIPWP